MKNWIYLLNCLILFNCGQKENKFAKEKELNQILGLELIEKGFLEYADSTSADSLKLAIKESFAIYDNRINRLIHVDAEELCEYNFNFFLTDLNKVLKHKNILIDIDYSRHYQITHEIFLNGKTLKLYTDEELEDYSFLDIGPRRFFSRINEILKEKGSQEKFYLLYEGNDLHVFLLTKNQYKIIAERNKNEESETPYLP